jgi:Fur family ferric uptake transcriptional regulator
MEDATPDFIRLIRQRGRRLTPQRKLILDVIRQAGGHLTIEQIYRRVREQNPRLNRATVYRNLDVLCDLRLVVAADIGGGTWVYESAGETPHHHLVCRTCGAITQIDHAEVLELFERIDRRYDFAIDMDHMALFGLCARCQEEETARAASSTL